MSLSNSIVWFLIRFVCMFPAWQYRQTAPMQFAYRLNQYYENCVGLLFASAFWYHYSFHIFPSNFFIFGCLFINAAYWPSEKSIAIVFSQKALYEHPSKKCFYRNWKIILMGQFLFCVIIIVYLYIIIKLNLSFY